MSGNLVYAMATLSSWLGWVLGAWALVRLLLLMIPGGSSDRIRAFGTVAATGSLAAMALYVGSRVPPVGQAAAGIRIPLVWLVLPFWGWMAVLAAILTFVRAAHWLRDGHPARARAAAVWCLATVGCLLLAIRSGPVTVLRGGIDMTPGVAAAIVLLIVAGGAGMKLVGARVAARGWPKGIATHLLLIGGSVLFGLPFAFLLITSFKEDRDMSSPNGIVWVPRVQQTVTYWDPKEPLMEGSYHGRTVRGVLVDPKAAGEVEMEIVDPGSMRGLSFTTERGTLKEIPREIPLVTASLDGTPIQGKVIEEMLDGNRRVVVTQPAALAGREHVFKPSEVEPVREIGLRLKNYTEALDFMPPETLNGLMYLKNTLIIVILSVIGTVLSSAIVAYAFARLKFPGRNVLFGILLATMMLPGAVTLLPKFLIFRSLGWIDTLYPLWVPAFFASAFNVFLLRQFFKSIPSELEDAARVDGCNPARTFWTVMLPLVKPALVFVAFLAFKDAWNSFIDPLIYISSPEKMPLAYALQLFQMDRGGEPGLLMAFATLVIMPVLILFFFAQKYCVEGVTFSGMGGR